MKRRRAIVVVLASCLALGMGVSSRGQESGRVDLVYAEDFSSDPGYTSENELYAFWDAAGGSYFACSLDVDSGNGYYMAYSPEFPAVRGDFTVAFDFAILAPDWGCYPGIVFQSTSGSSPDCRDGIEMAFMANYTWSDHVIQKFRLKSQGGGELVSDDSPNVGEWYHFFIQYHSASETVDWVVESVQYGTTLHEVIGASFPISTDINRLYIGEITSPPDYGESTAIRVDNIEISSGTSAVEQSTWGRIKSSYR